MCIDTSYIYDSSLDSAAILLQIANFYGAMNDEFSQPRHCWDPSGRYIYGVSLSLTLDSF